MGQCLQGKRAVDKDDGAVLMTAKPHGSSDSEASKSEYDPTMSSATAVSDVKTAAQMPTPVAMSSDAKNECDCLRYRVLSGQLTTAQCDQMIPHLWGDFGYNGATGRAVLNAADIRLAHRERASLLYGEFHPDGVAKVLDEHHLDLVARDGRPPVLLDVGMGLGKLALQVRYPQYFSPSGPDLCFCVGAKGVLPKWGGEPRNWCGIITVARPGGGAGARNVLSVSGRIYLPLSSSCTLRERW